MAIDSRNKRSSAIRVGRPWLTVMPLADGTVGTTDRFHLAFAYAGFDRDATAGPYCVTDCHVFAPGVQSAKGVHVYPPGASRQQVFAPGPADQEVCQ